MKHNLHLHDEANNSKYYMQNDEINHLYSICLLEKRQKKGRFAEVDDYMSSFLRLQARPTMREVDSSFTFQPAKVNLSFLSIDRFTPWRHILQTALALK